MGLSEVRRQREDTVILRSGNLLYFRDGEELSKGGVGFIVHKSLVNNIVQIGRVSNRVAYLPYTQYQTDLLTSRKIETNLKFFG